MGRSTGVMRGFKGLFIVGALVSALAVPAFGQDDSSQQQQAAPVERAAPSRGAMGGRPMRSEVHSLQPAEGVFVRFDGPRALHTVSADDAKVELKLDHGRANVAVRHPAQDLLILVDLPNGQVQLLENGFYTLNADTNTVRVLHGEANAFPGDRAHPIKVKEEKQIVLGPQARATDLDPRSSGEDVLAGGGGGHRGNAMGYNGGGGYGGYSDGGYAGYGDGFYGSPYGDYGYGWDSPYWGWGYPYYGGFGFYGRGFYGGGFRGGFGGGGFRGGGGGFHGGGGGRR